jgi:hypothetical protein
VVSSTTAHLMDLGNPNGVQEWFAGEMLRATHPHDASRALVRIVVRATAAVAEADAAARERRIKIVRSAEQRLFGTPAADDLVLRVRLSLRGVTLGARLRRRY